MIFLNRLRGRRRSICTEQQLQLNGVQGGPVVDSCSCVSSEKSRKYDVISAVIENHEVCLQKMVDAGYDLEVELEEEDGAPYFKQVSCKHLLT